MWMNFGGDPSRPDFANANGLSPGGGARHTACRGPPFASRRRHPDPTYRTVLVRERDDDDEADQHKRDQISIKPIKVFPVEVDTHRTVLLFAEVTLTIRLGCFRSNSAIPIQQRDSNARSTAARLGALHSRDDSGGQSVFAAAARTKAASSLLKRGASS
jgi:hypothetical protein